MKLKKLDKLKSGWLYLLLIIIMGALLRFTLINVFPPLLTQDEASIAFNAASIWQTGRDEWGNRLPLIFKAFGDAKQPLYIYLSAPILALTGWGSGQIRLLSALVGTLSIPIFAYFTWLHTKNARWSLLGALLWATVPWSVHLGRMALESNLGLFFFLSGLTLYQWGQPKWNQQKLHLKAGLLFGTTALLALSTYSYISFRLIIPLLLASWIGWQIIVNLIENKQKAAWHKLITTQISWPLLTLAIFLVLTLPGWLMGGSTTRLTQVGLLRSDAIHAIQFELRNNCHLLSYQYHLPFLRPICAGLWNKFTLPIWIIYRNWLYHLQPDFLFFRGDLNVYRNPVLSGSLYIWLLPLYLLGLLQAALQWKKEMPLVLAVAIALIPSSLVDAPQAIRLSALLPFGLLLIVKGGIYLQGKLIKSKKAGEGFFRTIVIAILIWTGFSIPTYLANSYGQSHTWLAYGQQVAYQTAQYEKLDYPIFIDPHLIPEPHIFLAYWNKISPQQYQQLAKKPVTDALGFQRPTQLGNQIKFQLPTEDDLDLQKPFIVIAHQPQWPDSKLWPTMKIVGKITSLNQGFEFGEVYLSQPKLETDQLPTSSPKAQ